MGRRGLPARCVPGIWRVLRYAVTLDNADRLAVLRIAREIDRLYPRQEGSTEFEFFRRTSAELCAAILQPNERSPRRPATISGPA